MRLLVAIAALALAACSDSSATSIDSSLAPTTSTTRSTTSTTEPEIVIPPGILAAMPFQNRLDVARGVFQMKMYNGTGVALPIVGVQLVWAGMTTPVSDRANVLSAGDRLDYPVLLAPATCVGDFTIADMPDLNEAYVRVLLADGSELQAPVFDVLHFARKLYLDDCERQFIATQVGIEWFDLHEMMLDGRPVTLGLLRVTRLAGEGTVTIELIHPTIIFTISVLGAGGDAVAVLTEGSDRVDVPVQFLEGRCDAHAASEVSQPFEFSATLDLGDGIERTYPLPIPEGDQVAMRHRVDAGCEYLGLTGALD